MHGKLTYLSRKQIENGRQFGKTMVNIIARSKIKKDNKPCVHYWQIESPNGNRLLNAICRLCGDNTQFPAYIEASNWKTQYKKKEK